MRGLDFESFIENYLNNSINNNKVATENKDDKEVVTELETAPLNKTDSKKVAEVAKRVKTIENYFGYNIFVNNPFGQKEYLVGNIDEGYILSPGDEPGLLFLETIP